MQNSADAGQAVFGLLLLLLLLAGAVFVYFLPSFIGSKKRNSGAIFVLNLLLGWTFIGWVIALVWAFTQDQQQQPIVLESSSTREDKTASEFKIEVVKTEQSPDGKVSDLAVTR